MSVHLECCFHMFLCVCIFLVVQVSSFRCFVLMCRSFVHVWLLLWDGLQNWRQWWSVMPLHVHSVFVWSCILPDLCRTDCIVRSLVCKCKVNKICLMFACVFWQLEFYFVCGPVCNVVTCKLKEVCSKRRTPWNFEYFV